MPSQRHATRCTVVNIKGRVFIYNGQVYLMEVPEEEKASGRGPLAVSFPISARCPHLPMSGLLPHHLQILLHRLVFLSWVRMLM